MKEKPTKPNGTLINIDPKVYEWKEVEVYWDLVDNSVWLFGSSTNNPYHSGCSMDWWKSQGCVFKPLPSEGVKEVKPQNTTFQWPDYWTYSTGGVEVTEVQDPFETWFTYGAKDPNIGDNVKHPNHYNQDGEIECIDAIKASLGLAGFSAYCRGNTIKYLWRYQYKNGLEDLRKANQYLEWLIETEEEINKCSLQQ